MSAECARLAVDLERLLPKVDADDLDEDRRIAFAEAALSKIAALEAAADGDATVLAQVATYEEAMLGVIDGLRPPEEEEAPAPAPAEALGLRRRAVPNAKRLRERSRGGAAPERGRFVTEGARNDDRAPESVVARRPREAARAVEEDGAIGRRDVPKSKRRVEGADRVGCARRGEDADSLPGARAALVAVVASFLGLAAAVFLRRPIFLSGDGVFCGRAGHARFASTAWGGRVGAPRRGFYRKTAVWEIIRSRGDFPGHPRGRGLQKCIFAAPGGAGCAPCSSRPRAKDGLARREVLFSLRPLEGEELALAVQGRAVAVEASRSSRRRRSRDAALCSRYAATSSAARWRS